MAIRLAASWELVLTGSFTRREIDVADVAKFSNSKAESPGSILAHEIVEQSVGFKGFGSAHKEGLDAQTRITGYQRVGQEYTTKSVDRRTGAFTGEFNLFFKHGSQKTTVSIEVNRNNVVSVDEQ